MNPIEVNNICLDSPSYRLFASVSPGNAEALAFDIAKAAESQAAGIEIKLNYFKETDSFCGVLKTHAAALENFPVILTIEETGTDEKISDETVKEVVRACIGAGVIDVVSVETERHELVSGIKDILSGTGVKLLLTYQGYEGIDGSKQVVEKAREIQKMGTDLIRVMYMAKDDVDVIHIARAAKQIKDNRLLEVPFCISAIGEAGLMLRLYAERVGNDFGFCRLYGDEEGNLFENLEEYEELRRLYDVEKPKPQSPIQYSLNGTILGGAKYLNCMMIKEGSRAGILEKAYEVLKYHPDIVEWRLDYVNPMMDKDFAETMLVETARQLSAVVAPIPIIMTFRIKEQGGLKKFPGDLRKRMVKACIRTGLIAVADVEIDNDDKYVKEIKAECEKYGTKLLLSFHDWDKVPTEEFLLREIQTALDKGADIPKIYLTANSYQDVIWIARTAKALRVEGKCEKPFCMCGMNDIAMITRILGGQCGSELGYFTWNDVRGGYEEDAVYFQDLLELFGMKKILGYA